MCPFIYLFIHLFIYLFIYLFIHLQSHVSSIQKYSDREFAKIANGYDCSLFSQKLCLYLYLSIIHLLFYLYINLVFHLLTSVYV